MIDKWIPQPDCVFYRFVKKDNFLITLSDWLRLLTLFVVVFLLLVFLLLLDQSFCHTFLLVLLGPASPNQQLLPRPRFFLLGCCSSFVKYMMKQITIPFIWFVIVCWLLLVVQPVVDLRYFYTTHEQKELVVWNYESNFRPDD